MVFADELPRQGWAVDYDELDRRYGGGGYPGVVVTRDRLVPPVGLA